MRAERLHYNAGYFCFYVPHLTGLLYAQAVHSPAPLTVAQQLSVHVPLAVGTFFLYAAANAWDDVVDAPLDAQVVRTARRPIPSGAVSRARGTALTAILTAAALALGLARLPAACRRPALVYAATMVTYPY